MTKDGSKTTKNTVVYSAYKERYYHEDIGWYISFGILCTDERGTEITRVEDVSVDEQFVRELADKFNRYRLDPVHILDVITDELE